MKLPSVEDLTEVFNSLASNGFDFLERAIQEVSSAPKFSVVHFSTGLELILKARLFEEHWSLIATQPHDMTWDGLNDGSQHTLGANDSLLTLEKLVGEPLKPARTAFSKAFNHRNRTLHFVPHEEPSLMMTEQLSAWYYLHKLLDGGWKDNFAVFADRVDSIESALLEHREYLKNKYDDIKNELKGHKSKDRLGICYICKFESVVVDDSKYAISYGKCQVCYSDGKTIRFDCGNFFPLDELPLECTCDARMHSLEYIAPRTKDEFNNQPQPWCSYCGNLSVVDLSTDKEHFRCLECAENFFSVERCEKCDALVAGRVSDESQFMGCVACQGSW